MKTIKSCEDHSQSDGFLVWEERHITINILKKQQLESSILYTI